MKHFIVLFICTAGLSAKPLFNDCLTQLNSCNGCNDPCNRIQQGDGWYGSPYLYGQYVNQRGMPVMRGYSQGQQPFTTTNMETQTYLTGNQGYQPQSMMFGASAPQGIPISAEMLSQSFTTQGQTGTAGNTGTPFTPNTQGQMFESSLTSSPNMMPGQMQGQPFTVSGANLGHPSFNMFSGVQASQPYTHPPQNINLQPNTMPYTGYRNFVK